VLHAPTYANRASIRYCPRFCLCGCLRGSRLIRRFGQRSAGQRGVIGQAHSGWHDAAPDGVLAWTRWAGRRILRCRDANCFPNPLAVLRNPVLGNFTPHSEVRVHPKFLVRRSPWRLRVYLFFGPGRWALVCRPCG